MNIKSRSIRKSSVLVVLLLVTTIVCHGEKIYLSRKSASFLRSLELVSTINADYNERNKRFTIDFYEDFGDVILSIEDEHGAKVCSRFFQATPHSTMSFSIQSITSGTYNLVITPVRGAPVEGSFTVDD
ncbi:hypothetical protein BHU09_08535 [Tannerella sp. oral taxon 808]|nr:hypothetical protein BHU09_08535 [Tannerella sp. oral taxon 808]